MDPYVTGSLITGGASLLGGLFGRKSPKIPKPKTAEQMRADMDVMYAGTTPWERLGASGGGVPQAAASQDQAKIAAKIQQQQHKNQMAINTAQIMGNIAVANINAQNKLDVARETKPITTGLLSPFVKWLGSTGMETMASKKRYVDGLIKEFNAPRKTEKIPSKRAVKIHSANWSGSPLHDGKSGISSSLNFKGLKNPSTPKAMTYMDWIKAFEN